MAETLCSGAGVQERWVGRVWQEDAVVVVDVAEGPEQVMRMAPVRGW